jgi:hypothetical protein
MYFPLFDIQTPTQQAKRTKTEEPMEDAELMEVEDHTRPARSPPLPTQASRLKVTDNPADDVMAVVENSSTVPSSVLTGMHRLEQEGSGRTPIPEDPDLASAAPTATATVVNVSKLSLIKHKSSIRHNSKQSAEGVRQHVILEATPSVHAAPSANGGTIPIKEQLEQLAMDARSPTLVGGGTSAHPQQSHTRSNTQSNMQSNMHNNAQSNAGEDVGVGARPPAGYQVHAKQPSVYPKGIAPKNSGLATGSLSKTAAAVASGSSMASSAPGVAKKLTFSSVGKQSTLEQAERVDQPFTGDAAAISSNNGRKVCGEEANNLRGAVEAHVLRPPASETIPHGITSIVHNPVNQHRKIKVQVTRGVQQRPLLNNGTNIRPTAKSNDAPSIKPKPPLPKRGSEYATNGTMSSNRGQKSLDQSVENLQQSQHQQQFDVNSSEVLHPASILEENSTYSTLENSLYEGGGGGGGNGSPEADNVNNGYMMEGGGGVESASTLVPVLGTAKTLEWAKADATGKDASEFRQQSSAINASFHVNNSKNSGVLKQAISRNHHYADGSPSKDQPQLGNPSSAPSLHSQGPNDGRKVLNAQNKEHNSASVGVHMRNGNNEDDFVTNGGGGGPGTQQRTRLDQNPAKYGFPAPATTNKDSKVPAGGSTANDRPHVHFEHIDSQANGRPDHREDRIESVSQPLNRGYTGRRGSQASQASQHSNQQPPKFYYHPHQPQRPNFRNNNPRIRKGNKGRSWVAVSFCV